MRIYHRKGATTVSAGGVHYEAGPDGGFGGLPGDLEAHLLRFPDWESDVDRQRRIVREDLARRRDPASQFDELAAMRAEVMAGLRNATAQAPDLSAMSPENLSVLAEAIAKAQAAQGGQPEGGEQKPPRRRTARGSGSQA